MSRRGLVESTQWAILAPLVVLAVLGLVHVGVLLHGRNALAHAALAAAEAQALSGAGDGTAEAVARQVTDRAGLQDVRVTVHRAPGRLVVEVSSTSPALLDLGRRRISAEATQPLEER